MYINKEEINKVTAKDCILTDNKKVVNQVIADKQEYLDRINRKIELYNNQPILKDITSKAEAITFLDSPKDYIDSKLKSDLEYKSGMVLQKLAELYGIDYIGIINQQSTMYLDEYDNYHFIDGRFQLKDSAIEQIEEQYVIYAKDDREAQIIAYMERFGENLKELCDFFGVQNTDRKYMFSSFGFFSIGDGKFHIDRNKIASHIRQVVITELNI
jgi:hypothetical protein